MWDSNAPLQLLKSMPKKLSKENLEKIQLIIDADKYKNSLISGFDLCGMYAPFCRGCNRTSIYPCAIAYINMLKAEGMDVEIDAKPIISGSEFVAAPQPHAVNAPVAQEIVKEKALEEIAVVASVPEKVRVEEVKQPKASETFNEKQTITNETITYDRTVEQVQTLPDPPKDPIEKKIRIAVARKKI